MGDVSQIRSTDVSDAKGQAQGEKYGISKRHETLMGRDIETRGQLSVKDLR